MKFLRFSMLAIFFLLVLNGCASVGVPTQEEMRSVATGGKTVVLVKVDATIVGDPYKPFDGDLVDDNICFGLGDTDTKKRLRRIENQRFLSPQSRNDGWTYMLLEPGKYSLTIQPTRGTNIFTYLRRFDAPPLWDLDIPAGAEIVYVGTVKVDGIGDPLIFGGKIMREFISTSVEGSDYDAATLLASTHFPSLDVPQLLLLTPHEHGSPTMRSH